MRLAASDDCALERERDDEGSGVVNDLDVAVGGRGQASDVDRGCRGHPHDRRRRPTGRRPVVGAGDQRAGGRIDERQVAGDLGDVQRVQEREVTETEKRLLRGERRCQERSAVRGRIGDGGRKLRVRQRSFAGIKRLQRPLDVGGEYSGGRHRYLVGADQRDRRKVDDQQPLGGGEVGGERAGCVCDQTAIELAAVGDARANRIGCRGDPWRRRRDARGLEDADSVSSDTPFARPVVALDQLQIGVERGLGVVKFAIELISRAAAVTDLPPGNC